MSPNPTSSANLGMAFSLHFELPAFFGQRRTLGPKFELYGYNCIRRVLTIALSFPKPISIVRADDHFQDVLPGHLIVLGYLIRAPISHYQNTSSSGHLLLLIPTITPFVVNQPPLIPKVGLDYELPGWRWNWRNTLWSSHPRSGKVKPNYHAQA